MTCIVGLEEAGAVWLGSDSAAVQENTFDAYSIEGGKVFILEGSMIIGYTSSFRMGQLLEHRLALPEKSARKSDLAYLVTDFVDAVRTALRDGGFLHREQEEETGGTFLIGFGGRLYTVLDGFDVLRSTHGYAAVGSGAPYAMGALFATQDGPMPADQRLELALQAAVRHNAGVRAPFTVLSLPPS